MLKTIFNTSRYTLLSDVSRARIAYIASLIFAVLFTLYVITVPFISSLDNELRTYLYRAIRPQETPLFTVGFLAFYISFIVTVVGVRMGQLNRVALGPAIMLYLGAVSIGVLNNLALAQNAMLLVPVILIAGILDGERGLLIFTPIYFVTLISGYGLFIGRDPINTPASLILLVFISIATLSLLYLFLRTTQINRVETQIESSKRRLQLAQLTTQITRSLSQMDDLNRVLNQIVAEIRDKFPVAYHVQVFIIEPTGRVAELVASTGKVGQQLLDRKHSLPVGSLSVIGQVTQRQEPIIAQVGGADSIHRPNELLPETRLEVALPLNIGGNNIGALDLQSKEINVFSEEDLTALQAIADSIAITISNSRLIDQTQQRLAENQVLVERMAAAQREVERLNRELTGTVWSNYLSGKRGAVNLDIDFDHNSQTTADEFTEAILDAIKRDDVIRKVENGHYIVAIPVRVRGEVIGAMEFEIEHDLSSEDLDMLREVGERFGLAAENNRLYENSQRVAQREALVNQIGTRIQSANSIETTLSEAARSLRDALKAQRVSIRLGSPPTTDTNRSGS